MVKTKRIFSLKKIISYILSIILVVLLFSTILAIGINATILNKENVKSQMAKSDYATNIYNTIIETCNNYNMQSGFEESMLNDVIKKEDVEQDINSVIDSIYDGKELNINTSKIEEKLTNKINTYVQENGYKMDEETQESVNQYKSTIEKAYENGIMYSKDVISNNGKYVVMAKNIIKICIVVLIILSLIIALIIFTLNKASVGISLLAVGVLFIVIRNYSGTSVAVNNILILNRAFSNFVISLVNELLQYVQIAGIILIILGLAIIVVVEAMKKYEKLLLLDESSQIK